MPRLRSDLQFSPQQHQGKPYVVVKDPVTGRYFRFTENQAAILDLLREAVDAAVLATRASEKLGASIPVSTIEAFLKSLEEKCLLDTPSALEKLDSLSRRKLDEEGFLYRKLASINPEKIFEWLTPRTRWAFTTTFHVFGILAILTGFLLNYLHWERFAGGVAGLFSLHGLFFLWLVTFIVTMMHEMAHGLTCCHFGGKVREVGFMLIYFQPAFYCDVSDSWMFPTKRQRMWVTFAGGYFQLMVWGVCMMIWRVTAPDAFINHIALVVVVSSGLQTLVNFNPLIKLDGYYMLSDYLEIPNLRTKAFDSLWAWIGRSPSKGSWREDRSKLIYAAASTWFSTTLLIYVYIALYTWSTTMFGFAGLMAFVMFSTVTLRRTAIESMAGIRAVATRVAFRKYLYAGIGLAALIVAFVGHWELKIPAEFKVLARREIAVRSETKGIIVEIPPTVREGSPVKKGDVLARLRDFEKQQKLSQLKGDLQRKQSELALLRAGARPEEIDRKQKLVETRRVELANARRNQEQRSQLEQSLERKRSELQLDQQTLARTRELVKGGLSPRSDLDKAETLVRVREREIGEIEASIRVITETADRQEDLKSRELAEAESELRLLRAGNRPELIRQIEAEVQKLTNEIAIMDQEIEKTEIRAPIDGIVTTAFVERKLNQQLEPGAELCKIADIANVTVEMQVDEKELADIRPGNPILMKARSLPREELKGANGGWPRVDFIAPIAQTMNERQMVAVRSEVENADLLLKPEMTGVAHIYCGERRIIDLMSRRLIRWFRTEFWYLLP